jgi:adenosine/AMP kinase
MLWKGTPYYAHINYEDKRDFDEFVDDNVTDKTELPVYSINTPKPVEIIFVDTVQGGAILGVVDGLKPKGIETNNDIYERKKFLRNIGYKF